MISETVQMLESYGIDVTQKSFLLSLGSILFNPTFWNIAARLEYSKHILTKLGGGAKSGCYILAATIFSLGILRDYLFHRALLDQPTLQYFEAPLFKATAVLSTTYGAVLVASSMWALGVTGTYLGDYFGILMDNRVTGFPFNVTDNPMYYGSTLSFLGSSLWYGKPAGLLLSAIVLIMYKIALTFEEPFTAEIYAKRERERAKKSK